MKLAVFSFSTFLLFAALAAPLASAQDLPNLPPITPQELALKDNPAAPGSPAMILYYAVDTDNNNGTETESLRIKIFREEGRKYSNVEIPYYEKETRVENIRARTLGPDGKIAEFTEQVYDREILKAKKVRVSAKVFTLPNVQAGTIIEYSYRLRYKEQIPDVFRHPGNYRFDGAFTWPAAEWEIQRDLFVRHGHFTLHAVKGAAISDFYVDLPHDVSAKTLSDGSIRIDIDNVPAYEEEDYAPPEANTKIRANMYYAAGFYSGDTYAYWLATARRKGEQLDKFIGKSKTIQREATGLPKPGDSDEAKLRRIYARVQQIRALSYEPERTGKEFKQEELKENKSAEDILNHGYAYANEINLLFIALARAAGFDASPVMVSSRKRALFMSGYPNERQLNSMVVLVRLGTNSVYLDPATRFCPYGLIPWDEADSQGIVVRSFGPQVASTPVPNSKDATVKWDAHLKLNTDGGLHGRVSVSYFGQEALSSRLDAIREDDVARQKSLEEWLKNRLVQSATVKLLKTEGWKDTEGPLKAEFEVEIPDFATPAGKRLILPLGVFHLRDKNPFASPRRTHPIFFEYPAEDYEQVRIDLPPGLQLEFLPPDAKSDQGAAFYEFSSKKDGDALQFTRTLRLSSYSFRKAEYPNLSLFYNRVMAGDARQATLRSAESASLN